jgi:hypothetical protein
MEIQAVRSLWQHFPTLNQFQEKQSREFALPVEEYQVVSANSTAVEFITPNPAHRIALYRGCHAEDQSREAAKDLALLERRAQAEGFQV